MPFCAVHFNSSFLNLVNIKSHVNSFVFLTFYSKSVAVLVILCL